MICCLKIKMIAFEKKKENAENIVLNP